jgi:PilZ domain
LNAQGRANTRLRYRFSDIAQARAHLHEQEGRALFFVREEKLCFLPEAPICIALAFDSGDVTRLLHGRVADAVDGKGTWLEIVDMRPLREISATEAVRRSIRMGCDAPIEVRSEGRIASGRMLDLSPGGARLCGLEGFAAGEHVDLRLLSPDRLTFHDLSYAHVVWTANGEMGVQFDRADSVGRHAVARLLAETEDSWASAWEGAHPRECCASWGVLDPTPPSLEHPAAAAK